MTSYLIMIFFLYIMNLLFYVNQRLKNHQVETSY